jgi:HlyD family secretion protein
MPQVPLGDGYRVETQIIIDQAESALTVPISALFPCEQGTCVFGIVGGRAAEIGVTQGLSNSFEAVVETGLAAGDVVIAYPESVEVGDRVQLRD